MSNLRLNTHPSTQLRFERDFSVLKITKSRLRTQLSAATLENLMIISLNSDMFNHIEFDNLVDEIILNSRMAKQLF